MKWFIVAGVVAAAATIGYAWWFGADGGDSEPLVIGERHHRVIPGRREGAPLLVLLHARGGSPGGLAYWRDHVGEYMRFYARALNSCR